MPCLCFVAFVTASVVLVVCRRPTAYQNTWLVASCATGGVSGPKFAPSAHHRHACPQTQTKRHFYRSSSSIEYRSNDNCSHCVANGNLQPTLVTISRHQSSPLSSHKWVDRLMVLTAWLQFLMKLFRTTNIDIIEECRLFINFLLPSEMFELRRTKFECKLMNCSNVLNYFGLGLTAWNVQLLCYIYSLVKLVKFLTLCYRFLCFRWIKIVKSWTRQIYSCLLYTSPSPRD